MVAGPVIVRVAWAALLTVRLTAALVLVPWSVSPAVDAVIEWAPPVSAFVVQVATPIEVATAAQPAMLVAPSLNATAPVAWAGSTVVVSVASSPNVVA